MRRSTPNGLPAKAPDPRGRVATRGVKSLRRMSSRCQAEAWERTQWLHRTVMAGWRWVKPGMSTSASASARSQATRMRSRRQRWRTESWLRSQRRVSVATWSLRERPVWSLPPTAPTNSVRRRSFAVWMSSSPCLMTKELLAHSEATLSKPLMMASASAGVRMLALERALAYAWLPLMSSAHIRLSKGRDSLNFSIKGSVLPVKRPPQSFFAEGSGVA
mmetsp:Transcript_7467/g.14687  ORF Transcript_7467/g.14687 Transcript_7467/m.14687 type:complete len:218 (-) Transcript_7467:230-883(-)